jgi:hypothetical protein
VYKSVAILPPILMHLMMAKRVETCCAIEVLNNTYKPKQIRVLKF